MRFEKKDMKKEKSENRDNLFHLYFIYLSHFKPLPFRGTSPSSQGINPSKVHALHFALAGWVSTPAPRQLMTNQLS